MALVYSRLKIFHFPDKIASLPHGSGRVLAPLQVRLKPTNVCNHRCSYCAYDNDDLQLGNGMQPRDSIPADKMMEIIDDIIEIGVKAVTFSGGGEPFVYPHLLSAVRRLAQSEVQFASLTNGSRLQGELAEIFSARGTWLRVSLDGWDGASYAAYRRVPETEFAKVLGNMEAFRRLGGACFLSVIINVDEHNALHVYETIAKLADIGVQSIKVAPIIYSNDCQVNHAHHERLFAPVNEQVARATSEFGGVEVSNSYQAQLTSFAKSYTWCPYIQIRPVIAADLNVYSCHDKAYSLEKGLLFSLKDQRFKEAWFSHAETFFSINPSVDCNHHCMVSDNNKMLLEYLHADPDHMAFV